MWYGKGPGVDRTGDAFRHANLAGTAPLGGVLVLMGDDHTCESSTTAHQSEFALVDAMIPVVNPAGVAELLEFGLLGFALSRYSGCWVGLKCVHDTVNTAASIELDPARAAIRAPDDFAAAAGRPQHPLAGHAARPGGAAAPLQAGGGARVRPQPTASTGWCSTARMRGSASSRPASRTWTCARRSPISASTARWPPGLGCACSSSAWSGRSSASACAPSPPASSRSSWSRRSAP